jgi:hypothetical protein
MWTSNPVLSIMTGRMETDGDPWLFAQQLENRFGSGMSGITRFCSPAGTSMIAFPGSMVNELETVCARPFPCLRHPRHIIFSKDSMNPLATHPLPIPMDFLS